MKSIRTYHNTYFAIDRNERFCHDLNPGYSIVAYEIQNDKIALRHGNMYISYSPGVKSFQLTYDKYVFDIEYNENLSFAIKLDEVYLSSHPAGNFVWKPKVREWEQFTFSEPPICLHSLSKNSFHDYIDKYGNEPKLACACGSKNYGSEWYNTDFYEDKARNIHFLDLAVEFIFPDNTFSFIYCEHGLEHLDLLGLINFFHEAYRTLAPEGILRFAVPSLDRWLKYYLINDFINDTITEEAYSQFPKELPDLGFRSKALVFNNALRNWGHKLLLDFKTYQEMLSKAGFREIYEEGIGQSRYTPLKNIESRNYFYNNFETSVIEARK